MLKRFKCNAITFDEVEFVSLHHIDVRSMWFGVVHCSSKECRKSVAIYLHLCPKCNLKLCQHGQLQIIFWCHVKVVVNINTTQTVAFLHRCWEDHHQITMRFTEHYVLHREYMLSLLVHTEMAIKLQGRAQLGATSGRATCLFCWYLLSSQNFSLASGTNEAWNIISPMSWLVMICCVKHCNKYTP